jgi:putative nucleotidyltransferase-like protein
MNDENVRSVLLSALRVDEKAKAVPLDATPEEWRKVLLLSRRHRVGPLLSRQLHGRRYNAPPEIIRELQHDYRRNAARNMSFYRQMAEILRRFHDEHIPVMPLKGLYLAEHVYRNIAVRPMGDVDLLVRREDLSRAENIILGKGFLLMPVGKEISEMNHHFGYNHPGNRIRIELHWELFNPSMRMHLDIADVWKRSRPSTISGVAVNRMSFEDLLIYLSLHAAVHYFMIGLSTVADIAETLRRFENDIDWQRLELIAKECRALRCLSLNIRLAAELFDAPVPDGFFGATATQNVDPVQRALLQELLFAEDEAGDRRVPAVTPNLAMAWTANGIAGKLKVLWKRLFPSRQEMALMYPAPYHSLRILLFYPVRLKDLLKRHGGNVVRLLRNDGPTAAAADRQSELNALVAWLMSD